MWIFHDVNKISLTFHHAAAKKLNPAKILCIAGFIRPVNHSLVVLSELSLSWSGALSPNGAMEEALWWPLCAVCITGQWLVCTEKQKSSEWVKIWEERKSWLLGIECCGHAGHYSVVISFRMLVMTGTHCPTGDFNQDFSQVEPPRTAIGDDGHGQFLYSVQQVN